MKCPKCGKETKVYDKRWFPISKTKCGYNMRRRECKRCGYRFMTEENYIRPITNTNNYKKLPVVKRTQICYSIFRK